MTTQRFIAPVTERWNEGERDWSYVKDANEDIARWEKSKGLTLPDGYRRFMLKFNGGRVYPRLFRYTVPVEDDLAEAVAVIDPLYSWSDVEAYSRGEIYGRGTPPHMLLIGGDPGGLEILLSLRPTDYGQIFCWIHTTNIWGTDGNDQVWSLAPSFQTFINSLYDEADGSDYEDWHVPIYDKLAKPLLF